MIVLALVAVLWIAVLVPTVISRLRERRSAGSIGRFHRRLDLLERTGPKLVEPAYRLTGTDSSTSRDSLVVSTPPPLVRPTLTLVPRPADEDSVAEDQVDEEDAMEEWTMGGGIGGMTFENDDENPYFRASEGREIAALNRRRAARRRRRNIFGALCALTAFTGLLGLVHSLRVFWYLAAVLFALLTGFVCLAAYGQRLEAERIHLARLQLDKEAQTFGEDQPSAIVKYLSEDELEDYYRETPVDPYGPEGGWLAAQA